MNLKRGGGDNQNEQYISLHYYLLCMFRELLMQRRARQEVLDLLLAAETETILSIIDSVKNLEQNLEIRFR